MSIELKEAKERAKNLSESEAYKYSEKLNKESNDLHARVVEGKVEIKQVLKN